MEVVAVREAGWEANRNEETPLLPPTGIKTADGHIRSRILSMAYNAAALGHAVNGFVKVYFLALPLALYYFHPSLYILIPTTLGVMISGAHIVLSQSEKEFSEDKRMFTPKKLLGFADDVVLEGVEKTGLLWVTGLRIADVFRNHEKHLGLLIPNITLSIASVLGASYACLVAGKYIKCKKNTLTSHDKIYPSTWKDLAKGYLDAFGSLSYSFLVMQKFGAFSEHSPINLLSPAIPVAIFSLLCLCKNRFFMGPKILIMTLDFLKNLSLGAAVLDLGFSLYAATHNDIVSTAFMWSWIAASCAYTIFICLTMLTVQAYIVHSTSNYDIEKLSYFPQELAKKFQNMLPRPITDQVYRTGTPNLIRKNLTVSLDSSPEVVLDSDVESGLLINRD